MAFGPNRTASAVVLRHAGGPRPWVIAVHGFCMGFPFMDFQGLQIARIHHELGMNVALPALPLHGPRRVTLVSGEPFLSFELMNAVHGLTQAVWDIRRLLHWVRDQGATSISLYGVSLGAYAVSLLAGMEEGVDAVVAGIPVSDFPGLFHHHSPRHIRATVDRAQDHGGCGRERLPSRVPSEFRDRRPQRVAASSLRVTATGWPVPTRHSASGSIGTSLASRGTRATTSATSGPSRCPISWFDSLREGSMAPTTKS